MRRLSRIFSTLVVTGMLAAFGIVGGAGSALAYGAPEQPLAQIELSANCNNLDYPLCQPRPVGFGLGGVWLWIEIDAAGSGDVAGAGCGVVRGVGGEAGSIKGEMTWFKEGLSPGGFPYWADST